MDLITIALILLVILTVLLGARRVDRDRADGLRLCRHAVRRRQHPAGRGAGDDGVGQQRVVVAGGAAAVHLDGRDPVPHQVVGGDVPRAGALAQLDSRPADARQRAGLRHLRLGVGLVGRDLRHRRQDRAAGTEEARLRRDRQPRLARRRRHARHPHSAVDHDGDLRGAGQRLDHPGVPGGLPAGLPGDGAVLRLHRDLVAAQSGQAAAARAGDDVPREGAGVGAAHPDHAAHPAGVRSRCCSAGRPRPNAPPGA